MIRLKLLLVKMILKIEYAMGFKLHDNQINYLFTGVAKGFEDRRSGFTTIYIIRLLLINKNLYKKELIRGSYSDMNPKVYTHYRHFFKREFMIIREKLSAVGLPVAGLI